MQVHRGTLVLTMAAVLLGSTAGVFACSGPGAARTIRISEEIGSAFAGISAAIVVVGCIQAWRRSLWWRTPWMIAPMAIHPRWWMDSFHGDCGYSLRLFSVIATLVICFFVMLVLSRPSRQTTATRGGWTRAGAVAGALVGLLVSVMVLGVAGTATDEKTGWILAFSIFGGTTLVGGMFGGGLFRRRVEGAPWGRFRVRTLLLLPIALAPLFVALAPVLPYTASISTMSPFSFVVLDDATKRPIEGASIQVIDLDDAENRWEPAVTGADGSVEYFFTANVHGRRGLLGETETITYNPQMIRVEAPGYRPVFTSLASDPPISPERLTHPPLGLPFPLPPTATIRMTRVTRPPAETDR